MSGFHENAPITYPEDSYGLARVGQMIQGVPDASDFHLFLDGRPIDGNLSDSRQEIDFRQGASTITREYVFGNDRMLQVVLKRVACLFEPNLALITLNLTSKGFSGSSLEIEGRLNAQAHAQTVSDDPRKGHATGAGIERIARQITGSVTRRTRSVTAGMASGLPESDIVDVYRCENSHLIMAVGLRQYVNGHRTNSTRWRFFLEKDTNIAVVRYAAYHSYALEPLGVSDGLRSRTRVPQDSARLVAKCRITLNRHGAADPTKVFRKQRGWLVRFWRRADIQISTGSGSCNRLQQALRWELFQLAQTTASVPNGISAKGLSGTGYGGHYFWDTEIYILPFLILSDPAKARKILDYRYRMLPAARRRAAALSLDGVLFPWRTINGEEASAYFPAGTAQYHINADIAYAIEQYVSLTGDMEFLGTEGIDILVETARMWASIGFVDVDNRYHIHRVTGPDEYSALVDDNFYTNAMARFNLRAAYNGLKRLADANVRISTEVFDRLNLDESEMRKWKTYADEMFIPYDSSLGIHAQDAGFLRREPWDFKHLKARPLLLHYHSLEIYKKQVIKQPDAVMALSLLCDEFSLRQQKADFEYYDKITTGDSTLSATIQSIVAATIGREDLAATYFHESLFVDIANAHENTSDGVHLACAGGVWLSLVQGFAGLKIDNGTLVFNPHLPKQWQSLRFRFSLHGNLVGATVTHDGVKTEILKGNPNFPITVLVNKAGENDQ